MAQVRQYCRTCVASPSEEFCKLNSYSKIYDGKTLVDLLKELIKTDIEIEFNEKLPEVICDICVSKLHNAYDFVNQAYQINRTMTEFLKSKNKKCMEVDPMDVSTDPIIFSKIINSTTQHNELVIKDEYKCNESIRPLVINEAKVNSNDEHKQTFLKTENNKKTFKCNICEKSFPSEHMLITHSCRRKDYISTSHKLYDEDYSVRLTTMRLTPRQTEAVDINLCRPNGCKKIECMICLKSFMNIPQLKCHLMNHPVIQSFAERSFETIQEIADSFFIDCKNATEKQLIMRIHKELNDENFDSFYSITNQFGYELSLSSTETESEVPSESESESGEPKRKRRDMKSGKSYTCEVCYTNYDRKYKLFEHQRHKHDWNEAVHVCSSCEARFVNNQLLEHHYDTQCKNIHKRFICIECPRRFQWKNNLDMHNRVHSKKISKKCKKCNRTYSDKQSYKKHMDKFHPGHYRILSCSWCVQTFHRKDYMLKHMESHHGIKESDMPFAAMIVKAISNPNGVKAIQCKVCHLKFERIFDLRKHIILELEINFSIHKSYDSLANYSMTNESGFELHIDDSDTDEEFMPDMFYECEICMMQYTRKFDMFRHQRTRHGTEQMPFSCEKCFFQCVSKDMIDHHRITQCFSKEKKFSCNICFFKFMWPENLKQHMLRQHKIDENK